MIKRIMMINEYQISDKENINGWFYTNNSVRAPRIEWNTGLIKNSMLIECSDSTERPTVGWIAVSIARIPWLCVWVSVCSDAAGGDDDVWYVVLYFVYDSHFVLLQKDLLYHAHTFFESNIQCWIFLAFIWRTEKTRTLLAKSKVGTRCKWTNIFKLFSGLCFSARAFISTFFFASIRFISRYSFVHFFSSLCNRFVSFFISK